MSEAQTFIKPTKLTIDGVEIVVEAGTSVCHRRQ